MTDREKLLDIRNQINEHFSQDEPDPDPAPDANYSIEIDRKHSIESGRTFPAGTPINYIVKVRKNGKPADGERVIFDFPRGKEGVTADNGSAALYKYVLPEGGIDAKVYLENDPDTFVRWVTKATGSYKEPVIDDEEVPTPEEPEEENGKDYRFDADGRKIHLSGYVPKKPVFDMEDVPLKHGNIEVGVVFLAKNFALPPRTRVKINNELYDFRWRNDFDFRVGQAGGFIINLKKKMHQVGVHPLDIWKQDRGNHGFGNFSWKILAKSNDYDFYNILSSSEHKGKDQYWAGQKYGGRMMLRHGWNAVWEPNPEFWKFNLSKKGVFSRYNQTSKFLIVIGNPEDWFEVNDRAGWHPIP